MRSWSCWHKMTRRAFCMESRVSDSHHSVLMGDVTSFYWWRSNYNPLWHPPGIKVKRITHVLFSKGANCQYPGGWLVLEPDQGSGDFWAQPAQIRPFTTFTGCNLVAIHLDQPISYCFSQVPANFFFILMTTDQELGHWLVSRFSDVENLWNAIMKQKFCMFVIHQTATSLQRTNNVNPRTRWYPTLDESNRMKSAYFTIYPGKNPPPQNGFPLKSGVFFLKRKKGTGFISSTFPIQPDFSQKPTGRHYTEYRFSPNTEPDERRGG